MRYREAGKNSEFWKIQSFFARFSLLEKPCGFGGNFCQVEYDQMLLISSLMVS